MRSQRPVHRFVKIALIVALLVTAAALYWSPGRQSPGAMPPEAARGSDAGFESPAPAPAGAAQTSQVRAPANTAPLGTVSTAGAPAAATTTGPNPLPPVLQPYEAEPEIDLSTHYVIIKGHRAHPYKLIARYKAAEGSAARGAVLDRFELKQQMSFPLTPDLVVLRPQSPVITPVANAADAEARGAVLLARIEALQESGKFEYVEPDYIRTIDATPADTAFTDGTLWGLRNTGQSGGVSGTDIDAVRAWDTTTGSTTVLVAVIDTGVRYTHQDLSTQMWRNADEIANNGVDDDQDGYIDNVYGINAITNSGNPMDDNGHGTHCSGTIGAQANGGGPHVGVAWSVKIMACKFLGSSGGGSTSDAIKCINFAVIKGAHILSNSWGGGGYSQALADAITAANAADVLFVAAAGNNSSNTDVTPSYPASYTHGNIVSVASIDRQNALSYFSNYGATSVDIGAPGSDIYSSYAGSDTSYRTLSGTSMATPHVAGVAALILADVPDISASELRQRIFAGAVSTTALTGKVATGGRVNAYNSLNGEPDGTLEVNVSPGTGAVLNGGATTPVYVYVRDFEAVNNATVTGTAGGSTTLTFVNNGTGGDATANDNIYTASVVLPTTGATFGLDVQVAAPGKTSTTVSCNYTLRHPAANDNFSARATITGNSATVYGSNVGATREAGEPYHYGSQGGKSVWWTWTATANGTVTFRTSGSTFDTVMAVYTGSAVNGLTGLANDDDSGGNLASLIALNVTSGTTYQIAVDGYSASSGDITLIASFVAAPVPPANDNFSAATELTGSSPATTGTNIIATKEAGEPNHGGNVGGRSVWWTWTAATAGTVTVSTDGSQFDTTLGVYVGGSLSTLTAIASDNDSGEGTRSQVSFTATAGTTYRIAVDGWNGTSGSIALAVSLVLTPPAPANDQFANRTTISGSTATVTGTTVGSSKETDEPDHALNSGGRSVWWTWTAPSTGTVTLATTGSNFDTLLAVYTGSAVNALTEVASNNQDPVGGDTSRVMFTATSGTTYQIAVDGVSSGLNIALGNVSLSLAHSAVVLPPNDLFAYRTVVTDATAVVTGSNLNATAEVGEPYHYSSASKSIWWSWTAPSTREVVINTTGSSFVPTLAVYTGSSLTSLTRVASNYYGLPSASQVLFSATAGTTYQIAVDTLSSGGSVTLNINPAMPAPVLGSPSTPVSRFVGESFSLYVPATSVTPMTFRWQKDGVNLVDGSGISGTTGQYLYISSARSGDTGEYRLVATNVGGTTTSTASVVTIVTPTAPVITAQPVSRNIYLGQTISLYVGVQYAGPAAYQWQRSTDAGVTFTPIAGATSSSYYFYNAQSAQSGQYRVVVTNAGGSTTSEAAVLTVGTPPVPVFTSHPSDITGYVGDWVSLSANVTDMGPATYQWQHSTDSAVTFTNVANATSIYLYISNVQANQAGHYRLAVTNAGGTAYSNAARVTLTLPPPPTIVTHPTGTSLTGGSTLYLSGYASGQGTVTYQWQKDGVNLTNGGGVNGATSSFLQISTTGTVNSGQYRFVATNAGGSVTSNAGTVTVSAPPPPTIYSQPYSRSQYAGDTAYFAAYASGVGLTYQWQKDGVNLANGDRITGATGNSLSITNTRATDAGLYRLVVSNEGGSATSTGATLTVTVPPAPTFSTQPLSTTLLEGTALSLYGYASSYSPVTYQWYKDNTPITGATSSSYSQTAVLRGDAGTYKLAATNGGGTTFSNNATVTVTLATAPVFIVHPENMAAEVGDRITLTSAATANPGATFQWFKNGALLTGATSPSLVLTAQSSDDGATFQVKASNIAGLAESTTATLTVYAAGSGNTLGLTPATRLVGAGRVVYPLTIRANGSWTATTTANWITLSATTGTRSRTLEITVAPNPLPVDRTAIITVGQRTHTLTQRAAGTTVRELWATGENIHGQLGDASLPRSMYPSQTATTVRAISAHGDQTFFIKTDGTLWAMGSNALGQLGDGTTIDRHAPVQITAGVRSVAAGALHTLILKTDGTLWATGNNSFGQLGNGSTTSRNTPVQIATGVQTIAAGVFHSLFTQTDGTLWAMGSNSRGQLGDGSTSNRLSAVQVATGVRSIAAGEEHSVFVKSDDTLWGMGTSEKGQLGGSSWSNRTTPVQIATGVSSVAAGGDTTVFIKTDASLLGCGDNSMGQLGNGYTYNVYFPATIATLVTHAALSSEHLLFIKSDGTLWATGGNTFSELGDGTAANRLRAVQIAAGVTAISAGYDHSLFLKTDETLWVMGNNFHGQLGTASTSVDMRTTPVSIASDVQSASAGGSHTLFVKTDGTAWSVGANSEAQLADGTTLARTRPAQIASSIAQVSAGLSHSLFLKEDGTLLAAGANAQGELGDGTSTRRTLPTVIASSVSTAKAGGRHTLFRKTNTSLMACGSNDSGQLGGYYSSSVLIPLAMVATNASSIAAGGRHTFYIRSDGTLWGTGSNISGQLGVGSTGYYRYSLGQVAGTYSAVAAGGSHSLFLRTDGTAWSTGSNEYGQLGNGTLAYRATPVQIATSVASVAAGTDFSFVLKNDGGLWGFGENYSGQLGNGRNDLGVATPTHIAANVHSVSAGDQHTVFIATGDIRTGGYSVPAITNFSPAAPTAGATVTINGSGFSGALGVYFNDLPATSFTVISSTQIMAVAPAGDLSNVVIKVATFDGVASENRPAGAPTAPPPPASSGGGGGGGAPGLWYFAALAASVALRRLSQTHRRS